MQPLAVTTLNAAAMEVSSSLPWLQMFHHCCSLGGFTVVGLHLSKCLNSLQLYHAAQIEFLKQARKNPELRPAHRVHMGATVLGAGCFVLEDFRPTLPLIHSVWHGLSAVALYTTNALVADADRRKLQASAKGF